MKTEQKLQRLLEAIDHTEFYTEEQLQELLHDDETKAFYQLMCDTSSAYVYENQSQEQPAATLDEQWERTLKRQKKAPQRRYMTAAVITGILLISGITFAAIHIATHSTQPGNQPLSSTNTATHDSASSKAGISKNTTSLRQQAATYESKQFDNVELYAIVQEMAAFYHVKAACHNDESSHLRLRFLWDCNQSMEKSIETLNQFEHVQVAFVDGTLTIQ